MSTIALYEKEPHPRGDYPHEAAHVVVTGRRAVAAARDVHVPLTSAQRLHVQQFYACAARLRPFVFPCYGREHDLEPVFPGPDFLRGGGRQASGKCAQSFRDDGQSDADQKILAFEPLAERS